MSDQPKAATSIETKVCEDGHIHFHLYDEAGAIFATAIVSVGQFAEMINHVNDGIEDVMEEVEPAPAPAQRSVN